MTRAIPDQIVAAVTELAESLATWCEEGRDGRLEQHEGAVLERVRQVLPTLLEAVVEAATSGLAPRVRGQRSACPGRGWQVRPHQERSRRVLTQRGMVVSERPWYTCARCHHGWSVVETTPGVGSRQRSSVGLLEVKLGMVAGWDGACLVAPSYVAAREPAADVGPRLATEAARRGAPEVERWEGSVTRRSLAILRPALILADGAAWIWNLADEYVDRRIEVSDSYHAAEHLADVAAACFPDPAEATAWLDARTGDLLALGPLPVLAAFDRLTPPTPKAAEIRRIERAYFASRVERMDYPSLRLDGLPIGSGAIESADDHVVQRRMKRAGMRWSDTGGDAMLALRARQRSRRPLAA